MVISPSKNRLGHNFLVILRSYCWSLEPIFKGHSILFIFVYFLLPKYTVYSHSSHRYIYTKFKFSTQVPPPRGTMHARPAAARHVLRAHSTHSSLCCSEYTISLYIRISNTSVFKSLLNLVRLFQS